MELMALRLKAANLLDLCERSSLCVPDGCSLALEDLGRCFRN